MAVDQIWRGTSAFFRYTAAAELASTAPLAVNRSVNSRSPISRSSTAMQDCKSPSLVSVGGPAWEIVATVPSSSFKLGVSLNRLWRRRSTSRARASTNFTRLSIESISAFSFSWRVLLIHQGCHRSLRMQRKYRKKCSVGERLAARRIDCVIHTMCAAPPQTASRPRQSPLSRVRAFASSRRLFHHR